MRTRKAIADSFSQLDVHDDTVERVSIVPAAGRSTGKVEVALFRHWENRRRLIKFSNVANISVTTDLDVLRQNSPSSTCCAEASVDIAAIQRIIRGQKPSWNLRYDAAIDPLPPKLVSAKQLILFRLRLFGGNIVILARSFTVGPNPALNRTGRHAARFSRASARPAG
jgi:hypothetical protein